MRSLLNRGVLSALGQLLFALFALAGSGNVLAATEHADIVDVIQPDRKASAVPAPGTEPGADGTDDSSTPDKTGEPAAATEPVIAIEDTDELGMEAPDDADTQTHDTDEPAADASDTETHNANVVSVEPDADGVGNPQSTVVVSAPVAEDVVLSEPVIVPERMPVETAVPSAEKIESASTPPVAVVKPPLVMLGEEVAPGTSARLSWSPDQQFDGIAVPTPVLVVNGVKPGKILCLTAAVHGDELNGIEIVRRVMYDLDPQKLSGTVIGVPIVNLQGFRRSSRYLPDRRDLNRYFPGSERGSSASRIAYSFFTQVVVMCDALVDIHTGSFLRTNLPQLRADMRAPEVAALTEGFGATAVLHSIGAKGTLRRAAVDAGIPTVTLEAGEPSRLQEKEIEHGTKGVQTLLTKLDLTRRVRVWGDPEPVYYKSIWVRANDGGLLFGEVKLGQRVRKDQVLGTITDPITNVRSELRAPTKGQILGMALNQVVLPGFAAFRIGIPSTETEMTQPAGSEPEQPANGMPPVLDNPIDLVDPVEPDEPDDFENS